jgi:2-amino-4,5-dihydroxy-6-oxo-7-(phosphonooxy)heptanoate synthase
MSFGKRVRLRRLQRHEQGRMLVVPLDHSVTDGPVTGGRRVNQLVGQIAAGGGDAVVLHKGALQYVDPAWFDSMALIIHLSASTVHAPDPDAKYLVGTASEAVELGADAVSVHVNVGSLTEASQVADLGRVAAECDRLNVPLMAMVYPRGPKVTNPRDPDLIAHAAILAADLGADVVKTVHPGTEEAMARITEACPVPVIVAGGPAKDAAALEAYVLAALRGGAAGVACGRTVFESPNPAAVVRDLSRIIHARVADHVPRLTAVTV